MTSGVTVKRAAAMREVVGVSIRTLQRWRAWWLETFPRTAFWTGARARFAPAVDERRLPASLVERFTVTRGDDVETCLRFLAPITTSGGCGMAH